MISDFYKFHKGFDSVTNKSSLCSFRKFCSLTDPKGYRKLKESIKPRIPKKTPSQLRPNPKNKIKPKKMTSFVPKGLMKERYTREEDVWRNEYDFEQQDDKTSEDYFGYGNLIKGNEFKSIPQDRKQIIIKTGLEKDNWYTSGIGSRKRSKATIILKPGIGNIVINDRTFLEYFPIMITREKVLEPLLVTEKLGCFDISAFIRGGGVVGINFTLPFTKSI